MGTDELFKKRKVKDKADIQRQSAKKAPYERVLIVCEGEKTEPLYFQELVDYYKLSTINIHISGDCGSDPVSVVNHGFELFKNGKNAPEGQFDRVYCVIDRDGHTNYKQALDMINGAKRKGVFFAANSVPAFEYWLLLHFVFTTTPFSAVGGVSSGRAVFNDLRAHMPDYDKGSRHIFTLLLEKLVCGKRVCLGGFKHAIENDTDNPSTEVCGLVSYLQGLKPK